MKKLFIIVEGQTELEFVKQVLMPYFQIFEVYEVIPYCVRTSKTGKGGIINYKHIKNDIQKVLDNKNKNVIVTTFIDFFRIPTNFPNYNLSMKEISSIDKVSKLEGFFGQDINDKRFVPYIQLHEFEALLFSSNRGFEKYEEEKIYFKTKEIIEAFKNPEDINSSPQTAPSKRLLSINPKYKKVIDGNIIALEIGIKTILEKCPRFRDWLNGLIIKIKE